MIDSLKVKQRVIEYLEYCNKYNLRPTYKGLASCLGVSIMTVSHIVSGYYKDNKPYTDKPHVSRCIDNCNFWIIQNLFDDK